MPPNLDSRTWPRNAPRGGARHGARASRRRPGASSLARRAPRTRRRRRRTERTLASRQRWSGRPPQCGTCPAERFPRPTSWCRTVRRPPSTSPGPSGASGAVRLRCLARPRCAGPLPRRPAIRWSWRGTWRTWRERWCGVTLQRFPGGPLTIFLARHWLRGAHAPARHGGAHRRSDPKIEGSSSDFEAFGRSIANRIDRKRPGRMPTEIRGCRRPRYYAAASSERSR